MSKVEDNKATGAKEKIILSAESLFGKQGYESTSVNAIIEYAQVSKGAFYHHFKTKEDLILAIIDFEHQKNPAVPNLTSSIETPEQKFIIEISRWFKAISDTKHLLSWMVPLMAHPVLKKKFEEMEPEAEKVKQYLISLLTGIKVTNPEAESEILYFYFGGLKMQLSIYPEIDLEEQKEIILYKYLKNN